MSKDSLALDSILENFNDYKIAVIRRNCWNLLAICSCEFAGSFEIEKSVKKQYESDVENAEKTLIDTIKKMCSSQYNQQRDGCSSQSVEPQPCAWGAQGKKCCYCNKYHSSDHCCVHDGGWGG